MAFVLVECMSDLAVNGVVLLPRESVTTEIENSVGRAETQ
jgi:hypothetical protein